ncbi:hypothetical protein [Streptosporangium sp. NPDC002721]|uniref:hypothetical protein n=1 Tax=Streptosporangium sp. NPDC002721 TaxID=3366188 RepID=UPI0036B515C4
MRLFARANLVIAALIVAALVVPRVDLDGSALPDLGLPGLPFTAPDKPIRKNASGPPPWTVHGHGWRFTVERTRRTVSRWMGRTRPSITITAYVTREERRFASLMIYRISDKESGSELEAVPFQGGGDGDPPLDQRSKIVFVVWDTSPRASRLTVTLHDFHWPDGRDLVLGEVRVPAS